jgi:peptidoglycan/xylan/chitin deacetylase (PgdA/CDA1 family)
MFLYILMFLWCFGVFAKSYDITLISKIENTKPTQFGEFINGVAVKIKTDKKIVALTLDACQGKYDNKMFEILQKYNVPATLFVTGRWIEQNQGVFRGLSGNKMFEVENHGANHKPLTVKGQVVYGVQGSKNPQEAFYEINNNANTIEKYTGIRPIFYRSGTAYYDDVGIKIANLLDHTIAGFDVLSGDAAHPFAPADFIVNQVMLNVKNGSIIIMHMNHPEWNGAEALDVIIPNLKKNGYEFVLLRDYKNSLEFFN